MHPMNKTKKTPVAAPALVAAKPWIGALPLTLLIAILCVTVVWATPRPIGDLFVAFAVGRDVMDGKLGKPDDWAFTVPADRVCFNQNWGTHLVHYLTYMHTGETGLLVLKFLLVAASASFVTLGTRQRGVGWPVAITIVSYELMAGPLLFTSFFLASAKKWKENVASFFAIDSANKSIRRWTPPSHVLPMSL